MPHWPHRGDSRVAFHRPSTGALWALALFVLLGAMILLALVIAVTNPGYLVSPNTEYPVAPI